tara:strand:+ start:8203 stop:8391 length:189 start_codon:yes stop_codon:yes gene_type:complete
MPRYYVELTVPDTGKRIGFYSYGDTPESVRPESPFILSEDDMLLPPKAYSFDVEVVTIEETE